jgi:SpoVK/Ycf46/Vps4 family AAA+-type ATPase
MPPQGANSKERPMTAGNAIRKLIMAHAKGDSESFKTAASEFINEERRKRHHVLADDLERILSNGATSPKVETLTFLRPFSAELPRDKERGALLLEQYEPAYSLSEMILDPGARAALERAIQEQRHVDLLASYGLKPLRKILFCGPPGCGKTMAAEALAKELYLPLVLVRFDAVISSYLGETAANLRRVFDFAASRPMVILFDEFDAIGKKRDDVEEHGELKRVVNAFLQMLDSFGGEAITIAATNHEQMLDPALWRRFDEVLVFRQPNQPEITELLERYLRQIGTFSLDWAASAEALEGSSHADVKRVAEDAIKSALLGDLGKVTQEVLGQAIEKQRGRLQLRQRFDTRHS